MQIIHCDCMTARLCIVILRFGRFTAKTGYIYSKITAASWIRKNLDYTIKKLRYITSTGHRSSPPVIIKRNEEADYKNWAPLQGNKIILNQDHFQDSSRKVSPAWELQCKQLSKLMRLRLFNTYILLTLKDKQSRQMTGFAHKSISADNSSHFLLTNKVTQFKIALTQYSIVQVKTWLEMTLWRSWQLHDTTGLQIKNS